MVRPQSHQKIHVRTIVAKFASTCFLGRPKNLNTTGSIIAWCFLCFVRSCDDASNSQSLRTVKKVIMPMKMFMLVDLTLLLTQEMCLFFGTL